MLSLAAKLLPPSVISGLLKSRWLHYGLLALLLAFAWARGNHYERDRDAWKSANAAQQAATIAVQAEALAKAEAQRIATENRFAALARNADHEVQTITPLRAAAYAFGDARRLRCTAPASAAGSGAAPPAEGGAPPDRDRPGADAVVLTRPEYDEFVATTLRLERVRRWGETLIKDGLAIPEVEFGRAADPEPLP